MPKTKLGSETKNYGFKKNKGAPKCVMNEITNCQETIDKIKEVLSNSDNSDHNQLKEVEVIKDPFPCVVLNNIVENEAFLDGLKKELTCLSLVEKNNDLYKFRQSDELSASSEPYITELKQMLLDHVKPWISKVTDIDLDDHVNIFYAQYDKTDTLLCHDDELEGRRVAFILYLVENSPWSESDGGCLELFNVDDAGNPKSVMKKIPPAYNNLAFFPVSPVSFHQVGEVFTDTPRLSVTGWFHGTPLPPNPVREIPTRDECVNCQHMDEEKFYSWLNPAYLSPDTQADIQEKFEESSEISLPGFLNPDKFDQVSSALGSVTEWDSLGPPDRRHRQVFVKAEALQNPVLSECLQFFQSEPFFLMLSNLTGLKLHELAAPDSDDEEDETKESNPRCRGGYHKWSRGCYTLIRDDDLEQAEYALDLRMFFNCTGWTDTMGGQTSYIARGEDEELITVEPELNSLSLVYRDKESLKFIKHVSSNVDEIQGFHDLAITYYE